METVIVAALLAAVMFWTLARAARAFGRLGRNLAQIERRNAERMADLADAIEQHEHQPRDRRQSTTHQPPPVTFGHN